MRKVSIKFFALAFSAIGISFTGPPFPVAGNLKIVVTKERNGNGQIGFCLFNTAEGFPHPEKAAKCVFVKTNSNSTEYTFTGITFGTYAISVFHDENGNKKLDTNWIGLPSEGVGVSNNGRDDWGPPKYKNAKFDFNKTEQIVEITIKYL